MKTKNKKNKGFTLPEIIITVVIVAILFGVGLKALTMYGKQSKNNIDLNNANVLTNVWKIIPSEDEVYNYFKDKPINSVDTMYWKDAQIFENNTYKAQKDNGKEVEYSENFPTMLLEYLNNAATDGLPKSMTRKGFTLMVYNTSIGLQL